MIAHEVFENGNHPFESFLVDKDGNILIERGNNKKAYP